MLEIQPVQDNKESEGVCATCGLPLRPGAFVYRAVEGGALLAAAIFDIKEDGGVLYALSQKPGDAEDFEAVFILGRGVLNFLDLCGVKSAVYEAHDAVAERIARLLGFRKGDDGMMRLSLVGLFHEPCQHGNGYQKPENE